MAIEASAVHGVLRRELENYIKSQYFGKNPLLLNAVENLLDKEEVLYQAPYIESSPAYLAVPNGIETLSIPQWLKEFLLNLTKENMGVFASPFKHQLIAIQDAYNGKDVFVATGTGSGKTECFLWPILAKLCTETKNSPDTWEQRGIRTILMYPMNALVSDQLSRLRRMLGDTNGKFVRILREATSADTRRPQFGMYTGRTPYPGETPTRNEDRKLAGTLSHMLPPEGEEPDTFYIELLKDGKIPAKKDLMAFIARLREGKHEPDAEDAELITRFEMQYHCPDILVTNYSMLEYMLLRPREAGIWKQTTKWLQSAPENKLLFIIDEAHMYRGSAGGEVALLIRRLFHKLGIGRDKMQFILTTASFQTFER